MVFGVIIVNAPLQHKGRQVERRCWMQDLLRSNSEDQSEINKQYLREQKTRDTKSPVYTIQPVVKPVWQPVVKPVWQPVIKPVWQPAVSCIQPVVEPVVQPGLTTGWMNSDCSFNTVIKPVVQLVWQLVVSYKRGKNRKMVIARSLTSVTPQQFLTVL